MIHIPFLPLIAGCMLSVVSPATLRETETPRVWKVKPGAWVEYRIITNTLKPDAPVSRRLTLDAHWEVTSGQKVEKGERLGRTATDEIVPAPFSGHVFTDLPAGRKGVLLMSRPRFRMDLPSGLNPLTGSFESLEAGHPPLPIRISTTRNGRHEALLEGTDPRMAPFSPLTLQIPVARHRHSLVIQTAWIQWDRHQPFLWLLREGRAQRQNIRFGTPVGDRCPVLEGLVPGDLVLLPNENGRMPHVQEGQPVSVASTSTPKNGRKKSRTRSHSPGKALPSSPPETRSTSPLGLLGSIRPVLSVSMDRQGATPLANAISPWISLLQDYANHFGMSPPPSRPPLSGSGAPAFQVAGRMPLPGSDRLEAWFGVDLRSFSSTDTTSVQLAWPNDGPLESHQYDSRLKLRYTQLFLGLSCHLHRWIWAQALVGLDMGHLSWDFTRQSGEDGTTFLSSRTHWNLSGTAPALTLGVHGRLPIRLGRTHILSFLRLEYRWTAERSWSGSGTVDGASISGTWCRDASQPEGVGALLTNGGSALKTSAHAFRLGLGFGL